MLCRGYTFDANHPFHLHGHAFRVMGMERLNKSTEPHYVKERDELVMHFTVLFKVFKTCVDLRGTTLAVTGVMTKKSFISSQGLVHRKRSKAPIKDSVTVPDGGYVILRFRADNPGFWFFHCHITFHVEIGMGLIIQVSHCVESFLKSSPM